MKKKLLYLLAVVMFMTFGPARAQMVIDADNSGRMDAHPAAALEIISSDRGVLIPRLTYLQRQYIPVDSAAEGLLVYQTDRLSGFYLYDGKAWKCLNPIDVPELDEGETLSFAEVAFSGSYNDLKDKPVIPEAIEGLAEVAYSGSYKDLKDKPNIPIITDSAGNEQQLDFARVALTGDYNDLKNLPVIPDELTGLAEVAFSGNYKDLSNLPKIPTKLSEFTQNEYYRTVNDAEKKRWNAAASRSVPTMLRDLQDDYDHQTVTEADKARWNAAAEKPVPTALSELEQNEYYQTVTDAEKNTWNEAAARKLPTKLSDLEQDYNNLLVTEKEKDTWNDAVNRQGFGGTWDDIIGKPELAKVATSGDYNDLKNLPPIPSKLSELKQDEYHRTISDEERAKWNAKSDFSGRYTDLTDLPTIPTMLRDLEQDYNHMLVSEKDIERWNEVSAASNFDGSWNSLTDRPTIPTKLSELEQNEYYQTVTKSDKDKWNAAANATIPTKLSELHDDIFHMTVTEADKERWNAAAEKSVPTRLSDLASDEYHQVVTSDEKRTWNAAADKISSLPTRSEVNQWQTAANTVLLNSANWDNMYATSLELHNTINRLENGDEGERLHAVAKSGNYRDLKNRPFEPTSEEIANWNMLAKSICTVAKTGSYKDLKDKPTLDGSKGDVTGSMEDGLTLKKDLTLQGTVTMKDGLNVKGGTGGVSITSSNNIKINSPVKYDNVSGKTDYDNYVSTIALSKNIAAAAEAEAKAYAKRVAMIPDGVVVIWSNPNKTPPSDCWNISSDLDGRFPIGVGQANNTAHGTHVYGLGETGGSEEVKLEVKHLPSHTHDVGFNVVKRSNGGQDASSGEGNDASITSTSTGDNVAHENRPPYRAVYFLVRDNSKDGCPFK